MARIPEEIIEAVRESADIVEVVSRFVPLKRSGSSFSALCPFHEEKTASFHVFPESGRFKCFGCGESGNVFTFLMQRANLSFLEALEQLASESGIALPRRGGEGADDADQRREALAALRFAAAFFEAVLHRPAGRRALDYLRERGITDETTRAFGLGFSPAGGEDLLRYARKKGIGEKALEDAGLVRRRKSDGRPYDMFRGRLMFPIHDLGGRVVGFGARALGDDHPKYLNSPDGRLFKKGREMYGLRTARPASADAGRLLVVEGYTDVLVCHQAGLREVAAGLGTALTTDNARTLRRLGVPVILLYDGDEAGLRAAERAAEVLLTEGIEGSVAMLPPGRDPADAVTESGPEAVEEAIRAAQDLFHYRMDRVSARHDRSTLDGADRAAKEILRTVDRISDPIRRDVALKLLSEHLGVPESTLRDQTRPRAGGGPVPTSSEGDSPGALGWRDAERAFVAASLRDVSFWDVLEPVYPPEEFRDPALRRLAEAVRELRREGKPATRAALWSLLAERDDVLRILDGLEDSEEATKVARQHLAGISQRREVRRAFEAPSPLLAVIDARRRSDAPTERTDER